MSKISKEKFKTFHAVFDDFTNRNIFRLISQGHFDGLVGPVSIGKEANIFLAKKGAKKIIVKIYRLENCDFNKMYDYIKEDPRYINLKGKRRKIIFSWAQREFRNLLKAREANVKVPKPITFLSNIIVMEYIGKKEIAPKLKDGYPKNPKKFADDIILNMKRLHKAGLVHADLSSFNILNFNEKPVFIDFSQCTLLKTSRAREYLERDITNIVNFFKKVKVDLKKEDILKSLNNNI